MKYFISTVLNLHDVKVIEIEVSSKNDCGLLQVTTADGVDFLTSSAYIYNTRDEAVKALTANVKQFISDLEIRLENAVKQ